MKKLFILSSLLFLFSFCSKTAEERGVPSPVTETAVFSAAIAADVSKTTLSESGDVYRVLWEEGDVINVNGRSLTLQSEDQPEGYGPGENKGNFEGPKPVPGASTPKYIAIYPASLRDQYGHFSLPSEQTYVPDGIAAFPMYAESDAESFSFKNLCGAIQLNLKGDKNVRVISLTDRSESPLAMSGRFTVTDHAAVLASGTNGTALVCPEPVALNTEEFTSFFITVPAGEYGTLRIIIEADDGTICTLTSRAAVSVERSIVTPINISSPDFKDESAKILYTTSNTTRINKYAAGADGSVFGTGITVVSHDYDSDTKSGVITLSGPVTGIAARAFQSVSNLQSMTIPATVTSIGERAFENCPNLQSLNFPRSLTVIGTAAFSNCSKFIPDDMSHLTSIGNQAFQNTNLTGTLLIGENLESLGSQAFKNSKVDEVIFDHTPSTMGTYVFESCPRLSSVTFNDGISIPDGMFNACGSLSSVYFNADVDSIGEKAFGGCAVTELELPSALTDLKREAFVNCTSLERVTFPTGSGFTTIPQSCFSGCTSLVATVIPSNVTSVGQGAFANCGFTALPEGWGRSGLTYVLRPYEGCPIVSVTFPDTWTEVPNNFCNGWPRLEEVNLGSGISAIRSGAFRNCNALVDGSKITIPAQVTSIESYCFASTGLTSLPSGINRAGISLGDHLFYKSALTSADVSNWTVIPNNCFLECSSLSSVVTGENLTTISAYAFYICSALTSVSIPSSVTTVGNYAFAETGLTGLPSGWRDFPSAGSNIFYKDAFTEITMPDACTTIPGNAFSNCTSLVAVHLNHVNTVDRSAFTSCSALSVVDAPEVQTVRYGAFNACSSLGSVSLPAVNVLEGTVFSGCSSLKHVELGTSLQSIASDCFNMISDLRTITILRTDGVPTLTNELLGNNYPVPLIYVPAALVDTYKNTSPWSKYSGYIFPIGDGGDKGGVMDNYTNGGNL